MIQSDDIRADLQAGLTVALVAIPQCMAFATIAGLSPAAGLYAAVVMTAVGAAMSASPKLNIGPAVTTSTMVFAVLATVAPGETHRWPALAGMLAVLVGAFTIGAALLRVGQFVRYVSRSVLVGLTAGAAILILGSQLGPFFGLEPVRRSTLAGILWDTIGRLDLLYAPAIVMAAVTLGLVVIGARRWPRFPMPFVALVLGGVATWGLRRAGLAPGLEAIESIPRGLPDALVISTDVPFASDLFVGAASIALVGIIQTLSICKSLRAPDAPTIRPKRELFALGAANLATGFLHGFPGAGSFARSGLNDMAGARTRLSGAAAAATIALIVLLAAPLAQFITKPAIAGLLIATAYSIVDWKDLRQIVLRDRHDRMVLVTTIACVFVVPIHWAILIGLTLSVALFLRRASRLHLVEMVAGGNSQFHEQDIDDRTGSSVITMLQVEGPLFFAHAEEVGEMLGAVFGRRPRVTIVRMRRTQQVDFSVIAEMDQAVRDYQAAGGQVIICGLTSQMRNVLHTSVLGRTIQAKHLLQTTREVFGSAHRAITLAREIVGEHGRGDRALFRTEVESEPRA